MSEISESVKSEIPENAYIEIVHLDREGLANWHDYGGESTDVANVILLLEKVGHRINFYPEGDPRQSLPNLPKDTPIILGGGIYEECVQIRADAYKKAGFINVVADEKLSLVAIYSDRKKKTYRPFKKK